MAVKFQHEADTGSNKPGKFSVQLIANAYSYARPNGFNVSILKPKIDRLSFTFDIHDGDHRKKIKEYLQYQATKSGSALSSWTKESGWGSIKYYQSYSLNIGGGNQALIQLAAEKTAPSFLRFEFNPQLAGPDGIANFRSHLPDITCGEITYGELASGAKITRLDIAIDLVNIDLEDMLVTTSKPGVTMGYFGLNGKAETKYLNVNKKGSKLYVYDRKTHLQKLQKKDSEIASEFGDAKYTRVEIRTSTNKPIKELESLGNRLKKINLIDIEAVEPPEKAHHWKMFQDSCRYRGLEGALNQLPDKLLAEYQSAISSVANELWRPDTLWGNWSEVIKTSGLAL